MTCVCVSLAAYFRMFACRCCFTIDHWMRFLAIEWYNCLSLFSPLKNLTDIEFQCQLDKGLVLISKQTNFTLFHASFATKRFIVQKACLNRMGDEHCVLRNSIELTAFLKFYKTCPIKVFEHQKLLPSGWRMFLTH